MGRLMMMVASTILGSSCIQASTQTLPLSFPSFRQSPGVADADGLPISGVKLCLLVSRNTCFAMRSSKGEGSESVVYDFGLEPKSERIALTGGGSLIFFTGTFSGGGSGTLERLALLRFEKNGTITNLLPYVAVTNVSERAAWMLPSVSPFPIIVSADFIWDFKAGETHFDNHRYRICTFRYDHGQDRYVEEFSFDTTKKYSGGDSTPIRVLGPERVEILRRLAAKP